jgi:alanyl-tRNA synthetase
MELCAGTHTRGSGEIGLFRILAESAIAAVAGLGAAALTKSDAQRLHDIAGLLNAPAAEIEKKKSKRKSKPSWPIKRNSKKPSKPPA